MRAGLPQRYRDAFNPEFDRQKLAEALDWLIASLDPGAADDWAPPENLRVVLEAGRQRVQDGEKRRHEAWLNSTNAAE